MSKEEIFEKIKKVLIEDFEIDESKISLNSDIFEDLELDSLDIIDFTVALEKVFDIRLKEEKSERMRTIKDIIEFVFNKLAT